MALSGTFTDVSALRINGQIVDVNPRPAYVRGGLATGKTLYVRSGGGTETGLTGDGTDINFPKSTLLGAITALAGRANKGDVIYVLPGHTENISAADYFSAGTTASYFSVIGLGNGSNRPTFTWTTATSTWLFDTAGVELANCVLNMAGPPGATDALTVAAPITVSAADCRIVNCYMTIGVDADQIITKGIVTTASADDFVFAGNTVIGATAAECTTFLELVGADRARIYDNWIEGATSSTTVGLVRGLTTASLNVRFENNYISNNKASSTIAFTPLAGSTGLVVANNRFFVNSGILPITASLGYWYENYVVNGAGEAGALVGTASA